MNPYIQSITIGIPSDMVHSNRAYLSNLFKENQWGNYYKYGNYSYFLINSYSFNPFDSIFNQITPIFNILKYYGILSLYFLYDKMKLHEIKLRFDIPVPGLIFCKTGYFNKVDDNTYRSNDYRQKKDQNDWSKGIQQSFLTVTQYEDAGSTVLFTFSGKYIRRIPFQFITISYQEIVDHLCSLASIYLTQVTNPDGFKISEGYLLLSNQYFQRVINDANWFRGALL
ncbi:MAG: hypothetical protein LBI03_08860 [Clostridiales bacterium]|jgi:hypothetical protein|nr:hypothetical protein [Clostridiales bacterium]